MSSTWGPSAGPVPADGATTTAGHARPPQAHSTRGGGPSSRAGTDALEGQRLPRGEQLDLVVAQVGGQVVGQAFGLGRRGHGQDHGPTLGQAGEPGGDEGAGGFGDGDGGRAAAQHLRERGLVAQQGGKVGQGRAGARPCGCGGGCHKRFNATRLGPTLLVRGLHGGAGDRRSLRCRWCSGAVGDDAATPLPASICCGGRNRAAPEGGSGQLVDGHLAGGRSCGARSPERAAHLVGDADVDQGRQENARRTPATRLAPWAHGAAGDAPHRRPGDAHLGRRLRPDRPAEPSPCGLVPPGAEVEEGRPERP